jgi:beta-galactosidase
MSAATRYIDKLAKEIVSLQCTNGGPILMVQVENEYGSFGNDKEYMEALKNAWIKNGINVPFYTSDRPTPNHI